MHKIDLDKFCLNWG